MIPDKDSFLKHTHFNMQLGHCMEFLKINGWSQSHQMSSYTSFKHPDLPNHTIIFYHSEEGDKIKIENNDGPIIRIPVNYFALVGAFYQSQMSYDHLLRDEEVYLDELPF